MPETTATELQTALANLAMEGNCGPLFDNPDTEIVGATTFEDGGVLTYNAGLTITLSDGSEFQVTIVRSR